VLSLNLPLLPDVSFYCSELNPLQSYSIILTHTVDLGQGWSTPFLESNGWSTLIKTPEQA